MSGVVGLSGVVGQSHGLNLEQLRVFFQQKCLFMWMKADLWVFFNGNACLRVSVARIICYIGKIGKVTLHYDLFKDKRICGSYGYSLNGKRANFWCEHTAWGPRITAIPVISMEGLLDVGVYKGHVTGEIFLEFVNAILAPCLLPFDGFNPRSIVILGT